MHIQAYRIRNENLPKATKLMNFYGDHFQSKVIEIISDKEDSIVIVKFHGSYPYITNQWKTLILPSD